MGYPTLLEEQFQSPLGYIEALLTVEDGLRENSAKSFIAKVKNRENLYLAVNAHVTNIIIDKTTKAAKGVKVKIGKNVLELFVKNEVIISAGSINSPQLLMLSGIGPEQHLKSVGIDPVVDLPVGQNLQDHMVFSGLFVKLLENAIKVSTSRKNIEDIFEYFMFKTGELAGISLTHLLGFINSRKDSVYPNLEYHHILYKPGDTYLLPEILRAAGFNEAVSTTMLDVVRTSAAMHFFPILLNPKSRGHILLRSNDSDDKPLIYSGYFTDEHQEDIEILLQGIRYVTFFIPSLNCYK